MTEVEIYRMAISGNNIIKYQFKERTIPMMLKELATEQAPFFIAAGLIGAIKQYERQTHIPYN